MKKKKMALAIATYLSSSAVMADISVSGSVLVIDENFNSTPLNSSTSDQTTPPNTSVLLGTEGIPSQLIIDNGNVLTTDSLQTDVDVVDVSFIVDGPGSRLNLVGGANLNRLDFRSGSMSLQVLNGGVIEDPSGVVDGNAFFLGNFPGAQMDILIDGAGSSLRSIGPIVIAQGNTDFGVPGADSIANVDISNGGELAAPNIVISGGFSGADTSQNVSPDQRTRAIVNLSGAGSSISSSFLSIGAGLQSEGTLNLDAGASLDITGDNGFLGVGRSFELGSESSSGELNISGGSQVLVTGNSGFSRVVAGQAYGRGVITVDGAGSALRMQGSSVGLLSIGVSAVDGSTADGLLQVTNGGLVEVFSTSGGQTLNVGVGEAARGEVIVASGGTVRVGGTVAIGVEIDEGDVPLDATVTVNDTGLLEAAEMFVGIGSASAPEFGRDDGTLRGTGTVRVASDVFLNRTGVIAPGDGPGEGGSNGPATVGTLRVEGNLVTETGGILEIDALEDGTGDLLSISGTATLNGGDVQALSPDGEWSVARQYTILSAGGGVEGTFDSVTSNLAYLEPTLEYTPNTVLLNLSRLGAPVQEDVLEESNSQELSITSRVVPTVIQNQVATTLSMSFGGASTTSTVYAPGSITTGLAAGDNAASGNVWLNFTPSDYESDAVLPGSDDAQSIDGRGWNLMIGADQLVAERVVVGAFVGAEASDIDIDEINGEQDNDGFMMGAYSGIALNQHFYLGVNGNYTWLDNSLEEQAFDSDEKVTGEYKSERYSMGIDLNAATVINNYELRGQLGYNYTKEKYDSYQTSLGDIANPSDQKLGRARLGMVASYLGETLRPYLSVAYENDVESSVDLDDDDGWVMFAGVRANAFSDQLTLEAFLSAIVDRDDQDHNMLGLNLHYAW